jgi:hypothetical protein
MKYKCKWCHREIEILQSEKAKTGLKKLQDHETECFKRQNPNFVRIVNTAQEKAFKPEIWLEIPNKFDVQGIIKYLHESLGRLPTEGESLRFHLVLNNAQGISKEECAGFIQLLKKSGGYGGEAPCPLKNRR